MMKCMKRKVEFEVIRYNGDNLLEVLEFIGGNDFGIHFRDETKSFEICILDGEGDETYSMQIEYGDYIHKDELDVPCVISPSYFHAIFDTDDVV